MMVMTIAGTIYTFCTCDVFAIKVSLFCQVETIDCDLLFGNMDEVAALSGRLLERLETATQDIDINQQIIG